MHFSSLQNFQDIPFKYTIIIVIETMHLFLNDQAKTDDAHGKTDSARRKGYAALGLYIAAVISFFVMIFVIVGGSVTGSIALSASRSDSSSDNYYYSDYYYYDSYYYYYK